MPPLKSMLSKTGSDNFVFGFIVLTYALLTTGTAPAMIALSLALAVWILSGNIFRDIVLIKKNWFLPVIAIVLLHWIGLLYSLDTDLGIDYALKTKYWIVCLVTAGMVFNEKRLDILLKLFWAGLLAGAFLAMLQFAGVIEPFRKGFPGFGVVHTLVCMYLIIGILMASLYFKKAASLKARLVFLAMILAFIFHLAVLKGRAGYLVFALVSPFVANNLASGFSVKFRIVAAVLLGTALLLSPVVRKVITDSYAKVSSQRDKLFAGRFDSEVPRFYITHEAVKVFLSHPLKGIGTGSLPVPTKAHGHRVDHPHNNFLYMGTSFGIIGIAVCGWLFAQMFYLSWKARKTSVGYFILSTCSVLFLGGMFDTAILNNGTLIFLTMTYGLINCLDEQCAEHNMPEIL